MKKSKFILAIAGAIGVLIFAYEALVLYPESQLQEQYRKAIQDKMNYSEVEVYKGVNLRNKSLNEYRAIEGNNDTITGVYLGFNGKLLGVWAETINDSSTYFK